MFDKFGEFDSAEEINEAAQEQYNKDNPQAIYDIAEENGIDKEDADDFMDGFIRTLTTTRTAAIGKIRIEAKDLELNGPLVDWKDLLVEECMENEALSVAVRRKDKKLKECISQIISLSFEKKVHVSNKIADITIVKHNGKEVPIQKPLYLGGQSKADIKQIIRKYYLG